MLRMLTDNNIGAIMISNDTKPFLMVFDEKVTDYKELQEVTSHL